MNIYTEPQLEYMAEVEYLFIKYGGKHVESENISQTGALPCFCKMEDE